MGLFPLPDEMGMGVAIIVLDRSLDAGGHDTFMQYEMTQNIWSTLTNIHQALVGALTSDTSGSSERHRMWISSVTSHSFWSIHELISQTSR
jgi:hypothetical protein